MKLESDPDLTTLTRTTRTRTTMSHHYNSGRCRHSGGLCFSFRTKMVCWMLMMVICLSLLGNNGGGRNGVGFVVLVSAQDDQQQEKGDDNDDQNDNEQDTSCVTPSTLEECRSLLDHQMAELQGLREQVKALKQEKEQRERSLAQGMQGEGLGQKRTSQDTNELKPLLQQGNNEQLDPDALRLRKERMAELETPKQVKEQKEGSFAQGKQGEGSGRKKIPLDVNDLKQLSPDALRLRKERVAELAQLMKEEGMEQ